MNFEDMFRPYSRELRGDLLAYLKNRDGGSADNMFHGSEHFFEIKELGVMVPEMTCLRVAQHPGPDISYFVNEDFMLESVGPGESNMSCVGAKEGVYDPNVALEGRLWSISGLNLYDEGE